MITEKEIHALSKKWQIDQVTVLREYIQILFLSHLYGLNKSSRIFFKGGTAIRLLYGSFRFSEDLDFTGALPVKDIVAVFRKAIISLKREIPEITLDDFESKKASLVSRIKYTPPKSSYPMSIHLEISVREKPLAAAESQLETLFPVSPYPIISHLSAEEILSEKIRAALKRAKGRDIFDIWFLLSKEVRINWHMVEKKMSFYGEKVTLAGLTAKIRAFPEEKLSEDLAKFLPRAQRAMIRNLKPSILEKI